ncbi:hypothetical protein MtrunA17_Chr2g0324551 [Medicago truncatula]|uniref:Uncharacterized protein n=1 Tax=Medicago truncatula TaxID=3880 RepID=A0A396JHF4_MEDTR|nr:hypothetical protein MtrunA17_Chr2g0324551 [Medicago truncatula]
MDNFDISPIKQWQFCKNILYPLPSPFYASSLSFLSNSHRVLSSHHCQPSSTTTIVHIVYHLHHRTLNQPQPSNSRSISIRN